jgi:hypothetical protein
VYAQGAHEQPLFYVAGIAALHAARTGDIVVSGAGNLREDAVLGGHANAFFENGATWAVKEEASVCVVGSADGWEALPGVSDPHRKNGVRRGLTGEEEMLMAALSAGAGVARVSGERTYALPLRREAGCMSCHAGAAGDMMGAVIYRLVEVADD